MSDEEFNVDDPDATLDILSDEDDVADRTINQSADSFVHFSSGSNLYTPNASSFASRGKTKLKKKRQSGRTSGPSVPPGAKFPCPKCKSKLKTPQRLEHHLLNHRIAGLCLKNLTLSSFHDLK